MISFNLLQIVIQQSWQVAMLASLVWLVTRYVGRERAHLSHMLWALVLIKCITPPIWSSPIGLFSRISNQLEIAVGYEPNTKAFPESKAVWQSKSQERAIRIGGYSLDPVSSIPAKIRAAGHTSQGSGSFFAITIVWIAGTLLFALFSILRFITFLRLIYLTTCEAPTEVARCVQRLNVRLGLRRKVGVRVVNSLLGPAVYGLWKPVIILPEAIIAGRSEKELEPLIAHELVHVRRGDLWLAWVQSLACCLGWFHPMVWLASRRVTIESERCCDEETIASLRCKPSTYARSLLDVLELKHLLRVAPALPGVRPVDVTLSRLERIMRLGHGSRSRSPWWVWCIASFCAIAVLPGDQYVTAQSVRITDNPNTKSNEPSETNPQTEQREQLLIDPSRLVQEPARRYQLDHGDVLGVYIKEVLPYTGSWGPIAVQENGTIQLPLVEPVAVKGLCVEQATELIYKAYLNAKLTDGVTPIRPIVTRLSERFYDILVVRQDIGVGEKGTPDSVPQGKRVEHTTVVRLPAYRNDVLHALMASGGIPGRKAKSEVKILRFQIDSKRPADLVKELEKKYSAFSEASQSDIPNKNIPAILKIPLRLPRGVSPDFCPDDIVLKNGDVICVETQEVDFPKSGF